MCSYGVGPRIPVRSSSRAGLLASSERSGIGGLPHVAGVRCDNVGYRVYMAQGILERINGSNLLTRFFVQWVEGSIPRTDFFFIIPIMCIQPLH